MVFWKELFRIVEQEYEIQPVQVVDKLVNMYLAASICNCRKNEYNKFDNRLVCIEIEKLDIVLMNYKGNSGYFYEYTCADIREIQNIIDDKCQTLGYFGDKKMFESLMETGVSGVDRIVPIGKTMDFDLIWDGYDLYHYMTRIVQIL